MSGRSSSSGGGRRGYSPEAALAARPQTWGPRRPPATTPGYGARSAHPSQLREFLRRYEEAGVDQLIFVMQAGHNRHEHIMESIELFGTEVLPEFIERDEAGGESQGGAPRSPSSSKPWPDDGRHDRRPCPRTT